MNDPQPEGHMASHIGRRKFLATLLGGAAVWPLAARAQQSAMPVVGFLNTRVPGADPHLLAAFRRGLKETGYVAGQNVVIEYRWAEGPFLGVASLAQAKALLRRTCAANAWSCSRIRSLHAR